MLSHGSIAQQLKNHRAFCLLHGTMQRAVHEIEGRIYQPEYLMQPENVASLMINAFGLRGSGEVTDISIQPTD